MGHYDGEKYTVTKRKHRKGPAALFGLLLYFMYFLQNILNL